jgi:small subunit ribosomal protein S1
MKQLGEDPWHDLPRRYPENSRLFGRVTNITDYGSFVEIEDGVEGLVHVSEMDWTNRNVHPNKVLQVGEEVEVMVLDIDSERRRISLGLKQCKPNPWEEFAALNNKNDKITGKIKSITDFGVFVGLDGGIDGLIHLSDLSWDMTGEEAVRQYKKGDEVTAVVIAVDPERERISLGVKQASGDPFASFVAEHGKGNVVKGSVESIDARGAVIRLADGVEGYLRVAEISQEHVADAREVLSESAEIEAKITSIERKNRRISLSMKALEIDLEDEVIQEYSGKTTSGGMTLGDKLKEQLSKVESDS